MNRQRIAMSAIFLAAMSMNLRLYAQASKAADDNPDCSKMPTRQEMSTCADTHKQVKVLHLNNVSQQVDANEILVALRNILDPSVKIYLVASENAIVVETYPQEIARAESLLRTLDVPRGLYRITYTLATKEDGKVVGTQHYSMVAANGQRTSMKQGDKVPVATGSFSTDNNASQTQFTYLDVGMNFDATATSQENGVGLKTKVEQSSIGPTQMIAGVAEPVVRQSVLEGVSTVMLGKPLMLGSIDVPNSTRHIDVDVMVEQVK
jgi:type II secretory pathway component GspD/PulD (secretin)